MSAQEGVADVYVKGVQEMLEEYKHKTARQKYAKSDHYQKFKQAIHVSAVMYTDMVRFADGHALRRRCNIRTLRYRL